MVLATHESGKWLFNPDGAHVVRPGSVLVLMTNPTGRAHVEKLLSGLEAA
jgi:uncharacterized protein with PhoU and TrkA domain